MRRGGAAAEGGEAGPCGGGGGIKVKAIREGYFCARCGRPDGAGP